MKKATSLCFAAVMLTTLFGCKDASADISNGSEVLLTVGSTKVTNDDIFRPLFLSGGFSQVNMAVSKIIFEKEVPINDEITKEAKKQLEEFKKSAGENLEAVLSQAGCKDIDEYYEKYIVPSVQNNKLAKKYLDANAADQLITYKPVKARIIACTSEGNAKQALSAVNGGESFEAAAKQYGKTDTYNGKEIVVNQASQLPSPVWAKISVVTDKEAMINEVIADTSDSEKPMYYVVKVTNTKAAEEFKEEALQSILDKSTTIKQEAMVHFLKEYNFHVYDIDIYNNYKSSNPDYLVQDSED